MLLCPLDMFELGNANWASQLSGFESLARKLKSNN